MGGDINNPVGHMLFGDSATSVRATIKQKELIKPIACSSCSVDPQCLQWKQQPMLVLSLLKEERGDSHASWLVEVSTEQHLRESKP